MSAQPDNDLVNIEIDGRPFQAARGAMVIQVADQASIPIPRFCYHRKLAVAANCRMCLVEMHMGDRPSPKPVPACATPVAEGMKIFTRSDKALHAQRNVMEFLLINHPLDCPICDQGGECELQDLSLGFGRSVSRFTERKRVVADENIGPLVQTFMTRCIHCTRCIRVLDEIAGSPELGGMDRGEHMKIGTYIGKSIDSELSGNIIDVCPVGALTDKVFQFKARAWEMIARPSIGYHDAAGGNLWLHTLRGRVLRAVPRDNEAINECWLADRDRYSHEGLYADDRVIEPMLKRDGQWQAVDWDTALEAARDGVRAAGRELGVLAQPATSCEEGALLARLAAGLGSSHVDHRLRRLDFAGSAHAGFEAAANDVADAGAVLLVGCNIRHELPLVNARLRKSVQAGASVFALNSLRHDFNFGLAGEWIAPPQGMVARLQVLARAAQALGRATPAAELATALDGIEVDEGAREAIEVLRAADGSAVLLGQAAAMHSQWSWLEALGRFIAEATGSSFNAIPLGANAVGLARVGLLPGEGGLDARGMLEQPRPAYLLFGAEPPEDFGDGALAMRALRGAGQVIACSAYASDTLKDLATVILPIGLLPEIDATLVTMDGQVQSVGASVPPPGQARPGWKVLRALGGMLELPGFDFIDIGGLREQIAAAVRQPAQAVPPQPLRALARDTETTGLARLATVPIYRGDAVLRRAGALNAHPLTRAPAVALHPDDAARLQLEAGQLLRINGGAELPLATDADVAPGTAWIECAYPGTALLPPYGAAITLDKAQG
ncbi:MAG TPA: NADH-quinone oxidoreductase subunit NuoG [Rhodanobacteraceae bacterium]|nr:NADH-quinone oxidoreductase subunit NuoG [Rhodanobacteraceae bacterium]